MSTRTWFRLHSFTGVITGLLLFVICWSGTFATVAHEIDWLVTPEERVTPMGEAVSWGTMLAAVRAGFPEAQIRWLSTPAHRYASATVIIDRPGQSLQRVFVDPYTADIKGVHSYFNTQRFFRSFHRRLYLPGAAGILFVSAFSMSMLLSLVAALCFYKRWWKRFFRFRAGRGRALWSELHRIVGLWSLWFVLVIGVTGLWYGVEQTGVLERLWPATGDTDVQPASVEAPLSIDRMIARAREARPDIAIDSIYPPDPDADRQALRVRGQAGDLLVRDRVNFVGVAPDGSIVAEGSAADLGPYRRWVHTADPLHFGDFGGLVSKLIWFVFGLLLCALILTGTYLHVRRLARTTGSSARHHWPGTVAATALSLGVLVMSVPLGLTEIRAAYGPSGAAGAEFPRVAPGVASVVLAWSALTVAIVGLWAWMLPGMRASRPVHS